MKAVSTKLYYSISEVAKIAGVEQHVLRYWESEFPKLKPKKNRAGNRQYREKDIKIIRYIRHLLHNDMYTVQGAKKKLAESGYREVEGQLDLLSAIPRTAPPVREVPNPVFAEPASAPKQESVPATPAAEAPAGRPGRHEALLTGILAELRTIHKLLCL